MNITIKSRLLTHTYHPLLPTYFQKRLAELITCFPAGSGELKLSYDLSQNPMLHIGGWNSQAGSRLSVKRTWCLWEGLYVKGQLMIILRLEVILRHSLVVFHNLFLFSEENIEKSKPLQHKLQERPQLIPPKCPIYDMAVTNTPSCSCRG